MSKDKQFGSTVADCFIIWVNILETANKNKKDERSHNTPSTHNTD
jgi:hypothetical protein